MCFTVAPRIEIAQTTYNSESGAPLDIPCIGSGDPRPAVDWIRNSETVSSRTSGTVRQTTSFTSSNDETSTLRFSNVRKLSKILFN